MPIGVNLSFETSLLSARWTPVELVLALASTPNHSRIRYASTVRFTRMDASPGTKYRLHSPSIPLGMHPHRRKPKLRNKSSLGEIDACRTRYRIGVNAKPLEDSVRVNVRFTRMDASPGTKYRLHSPSIPLGMHRSVENAVSCSLHPVRDASIGSLEASFGIDRNVGLFFGHEPDRLGCFMQGLFLSEAIAPQKRKGSKKSACERMVGRRCWRLVIDIVRVVAVYLPTAFCVDIVPKRWNVSPLRISTWPCLGKRC